MPLLPITRSTKRSRAKLQKSVLKSPKREKQRSANPQTN